MHTQPVHLNIKTGFLSVFPDNISIEGIRIERPLQLSRDRPDPPTVIELSEYLIMDRSTLGHNLRPLLRSGLVALKRDDKDGRTRRVTLTTKGVAKFSESKKLWWKAQQEHELAMGKEAAVHYRFTPSSFQSGSSGIHSHQLWLVRPSFRLGNGEGVVISKSCAATSVRVAPRFRSASLEAHRRVRSPLPRPCRYDHTGAVQPEIEK